MVSKTETIHIGDQELVITIEEDDDGRYVAGCDLFCTYGLGRTEEEAKTNYEFALREDAEWLIKHEGNLGKRLQDELERIRQFLSRAIVASNNKPY